MQLPDIMVSHPVSLSAINGSFLDSKIEIRPNQSLDRALFNKCRLLFIIVTAAVAGFSFLQGNWFAPFFALVNVLVLSLVVELVWRSQDFEEQLWLENGKVIAESRHGARVQRVEFDLNWVRFESDRAAHCAGTLTSHGIQFRLGGFLNAEQRKLLAYRVQDFLRRAQAAGAVNEDNLNNRHQAKSL